MFLKVGRNAKKGVLGGTGGEGRSILWKRTLPRLRITSTKFGNYRA